VTAPASPLAARFAGRLNGSGGARDGEILVVAVSGGVDSVALLHLLRFTPGLPDVTLVAAHVDARPDEPVPVVAPGPDDVPAVVLDPAHTHETLGWRARVGFAETMARVLEWYDAHGVTDVYSHLKAPR